MTMLSSSCFPLQRTEFDLISRILFRHLSRDCCCSICHVFDGSCGAWNEMFSWFSTLWLLFFCFDFQTRDDGDAHDAEMTAARWIAMFHVASCCLCYCLWWDARVFWIFWGCWRNCDDLVEGFAFCVELFEVGVRFGWCNYNWISALYFAACSHRPLCAANDTKIHKQYW